VCSMRAGRVGTSQRDRLLRAVRGGGTPGVLRGARHPHRALVVSTLRLQPPALGPRSAPPRAPPRRACRAGPPRGAVRAVPGPHWGPEARHRGRAGPGPALGARLLCPVDAGDQPGQGGGGAGGGAGDAGGRQGRRALQPVREQAGSRPRGEGEGQRGREGGHTHVSTCAVLVVARHRGHSPAC
jgi:hypothetical protein